MVRPKRRLRRTGKGREINPVAIAMMQLYDIQSQEVKDRGKGLVKGQWCLQSTVL